jgi:hypothetical protein
MGDMMTKYEKYGNSASNDHRFGPSLRERSAELPLGNDRRPGVIRRRDPRGEGDLLRELEYHEKQLVYHKGREAHHKQHKADHRRHVSRLRADLLKPSATGRRRGSPRRLESKALLPFLEQLSWAVISNPRGSHAGWARQILGLVGSAKDWTVKESNKFRAMTVKIERHLKDMTIEERRALMPGARHRPGFKTDEQSHRGRRSSFGEHAMS